MCIFDRLNYLEIIELVGIVDNITSNHSGHFYEPDQLKSGHLTREDQNILNSYKNIVDSLAEVIGPFCAISLYAREEETISVLKMVHGDDIGQNVDSALTGLALKMLHDVEGLTQRKRDQQNFSQTYFTQLNHAAFMKSNMIAIQNSASNIIGLLCIHINLHAPLSQIIQSFVPAEEIDSSSGPALVATNVEALVDQALEDTIADVNADKSLSNHMKNKQVVIELHDKGIFDIKDAINRVADRLNISKHTVYLYIRQRKTE